MRHLSSDSRRLLGTAAAILVAPLAWWVLFAARGRQSLDFIYFQF